MKRSLALLGVARTARRRRLRRQRQQQLVRRRPRQAATGSGKKIGLVTDIGGLNDRGFNHLSYLGLQRARRELGVQTAVFQAKSTQDYVPNLSTFARQGYDLTIGVGFTEATAIDDGRHELPELELRDRRRRPDDRAGQADEPARPALQGAGDRLPRRLSRRARGEAAARPGRDRIGRRPEAAAGRPLHRGLPGRREGRRPRDQDAERVLAGLHRSGEVQADRAEPDRAGRRRRSSRSPAVAGSVRSTRRRRRASGGSASTPTSRSSGRTS